MTGSDGASPRGIPETGVALSVLGKLSLSRKVLLRAREVEHRAMDGHALHASRFSQARRASPRRESPAWRGRRWGAPPA
eukprot:4234775-Prymnesium_polylepis.1